MKKTISAALFAGLLLTGGVEAGHCSGCIQVHRAPKAPKAQVDPLRSYYDLSCGYLGHNAHYYA